MVTESADSSSGKPVENGGEASLLSPLAPERLVSIVEYGPLSLASDPAASLHDRNAAAARPKATVIASKEVFFMGSLGEILPGETAGVEE